MVEPDRPKRGNKIWWNQTDQNVAIKYGGTRQTKTWQKNVVEPDRPNVAIKYGRTRKTKTWQ